MQRQHPRINGKIEGITIRIKGELSELVRGEDRSAFENMKPVYYSRLISNAWYNIFDPSKSQEEKDRYYRTVRNVFGNFADRYAAYAIRSWMHPINRDFFDRSNVRNMFSRIKDRRYLLVPVMAEGIAAGALVYDYLNRRDMLLGTAFVGHLRGRYMSAAPEYYKPRTVYILEQDLKTLREDTKRPVLIVDDVVHERITVNAVTAKLKSLGIRDIHFTYLVDMKGVY